ncbi:MAG TPA: hypothetical protein VFS88_00350 [Micavibrio sp.]|nr:hypothetical protein [Micavibrio sp.]
MLRLNLTDKFSALLNLFNGPCEGIKLEVKVKGFDVLLAEGDKKGEYRLGIRSNGNNPLYPAEESVKEIHLKKSDDQFNPTKAQTRDLTIS